VIEDNSAVTHHYYVISKQTGKSTFQTTTHTLKLKFLPSPSPHTNLFIVVAIVKATETAVWWHKYSRFVAVMVTAATATCDGGCVMIGLGHTTQH
jgi:hypothetical protein